jgi:hypothetical protein
MVTIKDLPEEIINRIMRFNIHPVAQLFKNALVKKEGYTELSDKRNPLMWDDDQYDRDEDKCDNHHCYNGCKYHVEKAVLERCILWRYNAKYFTYNIINSLSPIYFHMSKDILYDIVDEHRELLSDATSWSNDTENLFDDTDFYFDDW